MNLTCIIENTIEPPEFLFWYHNNDVCMFVFFFKVSYKIDKELFIKRGHFQK